MRGLKGSSDKEPPPLTARMGFFVLLFSLVMAIAPAEAQLPPAGLFEQVPSVGADARIEANMLAFDHRTTIISAEDEVVMHYEGYTITADRMTYNQTTGEMFADGNVEIRDPSG